MSVGCGCCKIRRFRKTGKINFSITKEYFQVIATIKNRYLVTIIQSPYVKRETFLTFGFSAISNNFEKPKKKTMGLLTVECE